MVPEFHFVLGSLFLSLKLNRRSSKVVAKARAGCQEQQTGWDAEQGAVVPPLRIIRARYARRGSQLFVVKTADVRTPVRRCQEEPRGLAPCRRSPSLHSLSLHKDSSQACGRKQISKLSACLENPFNWFPRITPMFIPFHTLQYLFRCVVSVIYIQWKLWT